MSNLFSPFRKDNIFVLSLQTQEEKYAFAI